LKLLILDNYDSFTYNLVHLIEKVSEIPFDVIRNDKISLTEINQYQKILLSPGPGLPKEAGIMPELLKTYTTQKSILGVCLGMQAIGEHFGGKLENLQEVCHGQSKPIFIKDNDSLFKHCPESFKVGRYHSWVLSNHSFPSELRVTSVDENGNIMSIAHRTLNIKGVQFHPESILSEYGEQIIKNWLSN
jgi:anthranilate synthase component 2